MERETKVAIFESDEPAEIQLIKSKLKEAGIESSANNSYMTFTTTPTATALRLFVNLKDESAAFEIVDTYLKETEPNINQN